MILIRKIIFKRINVAAISMVAMIIASLVDGIAQLAYRVTVAIYKEIAVIINPVNRNGEIRVIIYYALPGVILGEQEPLIQDIDGIDRQMTNAAGAVFIGFTIMDAIMTAITALGVIKYVLGQYVSRKATHAARAVRRMHTRVNCGIYRA